MPRNGFRSAEELHKRAQSFRPFIVAVTGGGDHRDSAERAGVDYYLLKPAEPETFVNLAGSLALVLAKPDTSAGELARRIKEGTKPSHRSGQRKAAGTSSTARGQRHVTCERVNGSTNHDSNSFYRNPDVGRDMGNNGSVSSSITSAGWRTVLPEAGNASSCPVCGSDSTHRIGKCWPGSSAWPASPGAWDRFLCEACWHRWEVAADF